MSGGSSTLEWFATISTDPCAGMFSTPIASSRNMRRMNASVGTLQAAYNRFHGVVAPPPFL